MDKILQNFTGACPGLYPTAPKTSQVEVFLFPVITSKIHYDGLSSCFDMVFLPFMPLDCFYKQRVSNSHMLWWPSFHRSPYYAHYFNMHTTHNNILAFPLLKIAQKVEKFIKNWEICKWVRIYHTAYDELNLRIFNILWTF